MSASTAEARAERDMEKCLCSPTEYVGRVQAGDLHGDHASTWVCGLAAHREAAERWVRACTGLEPRFIPKAKSGEQE